MLLLGSSSGPDVGHIVNGHTRMVKYTAVADGTLTNLRLIVYGDSSYTLCDLVVYSDVAGYPGSYLTGNPCRPPIVGAGVSESIGVIGSAELPIVAGTSYWLGVHPHGGDLYCAVDTAGTHDTWETTSGAGSIPDPFPDSGSAAEASSGIALAADGNQALVFGGGLEWHVTGLQYPDAGAPTYYGQIADPQNDSVTIPLDDSRLCEITVSAWDPIVTDLVFHSYARMFKVYYHGALVFWGPFKLSKVSSDDMTVTFSGVDPSLRAIRHYLRRDDINGDLSAANDDKATVPIDGIGLRLLLDAARNIAAQTARGVPDIGIDPGVDFATPAPDALMGVSRGMEVWGSIVQLSQSLGPDFELVPTDDVAPNYVELRTYDVQGQDRTYTVQLHYALGLNNLAGMVIDEGSEYVTHAHVLSSDGRRVTSVDVESSAETGQYTAWDATDYDAAGIPPTEADQVLEQYGEAIIKAYGRPLIAVTVTMPIETEGGYLYLRDYGVGDIVSAAGQIGLVALAEAPHRVTQVKLGRDEAGNVRPELQLIPDRVGTAGDTITGTEDS